MTRAPLIAATVVLATAMTAPAASETCAVGTWNVPGAESTSDVRELLAGIAARPAVLLGETHASAEHHRWQLHTLAALHAYNPNMLLGFEMVPRDRQPVLDAWVRGELTPDAFLEQVDWAEVWGYDADFYMPLFQFARQHRIPVVALNVSRDLVRRVGSEGWSAVPEDERADIGDPAEPAELYRRSLAEVFAFKRKHGMGSPAPGGALDAPNEDEIAEALETPGFENFVDAQLVWDRAMAEAIAEAHDRGSRPLIVGIVGRGHAEHGWGIPHQLKDLGIADTAVLLPADGADACASAEPGVADAVFVVERMVIAAEPRARLGVRIEAAESGGARVVDVLDGSVAEAANLAKEDVITEAAGTAIGGARDLVAVVRRQAPGTWLPLTVRRGDSAIEIVAKFPNSFGDQP